MAADPYRYFRIEAREILAGLSAGSVALDKTRGDGELVARLLRLAHTLKGAARIVKQHAIAELAHAIEGLLEPARGGAPPTQLREVLARIDEMSRLVDELPVPAASAAPAALVATAAPRTQAPEPIHLPQTDTAAIDGLLGGLAEALIQVGRLRTDRDPRTAGTRIDHIDRELREIRREIERLRLQPAGSLFGTLERAARDAAGAMGADRRVELVTSGGEVRLDGAVLGPVHRALVQLVRNAVAHGLEPTRDRLAAGKPAVGRLSLDVRLSGPRVVFSCQDDGRGIDLDAVRRAAERQGAGKLAAADVVERLLRGGLTTATTVTEHAGRGIGLDVVRDVARELGGEVTARTEAGRGTTIALAVPVSMTAMTALVVQAAGRAAAIPLAGIRRVIGLRGDEITRSPEGIAIALDDVVVPYRGLATLLGGEPPRGRHPAVIVDDRGELAAIGIDRLVGVEDIVLRALPAGVPVDPVVWGIALDDEGVPRPVLEPAALIAAARRPFAAHAAPVRTAPSILVVDDSVTTRMLEQSILESAGYQVELAGSAEEALDKAADRAYALFLVDVEMPGMDGFAFISEIRRRPPLAHIPAILVTSRAAAEDRRRGEAVGAQGYVIKSEFDQVTLLASIRKLVGS